MVREGAKIEPLVSDLKSRVGHLEERAGDLRPSPPEDRYLVNLSLRVDELHEALCAQSRTSPGSDPQADLVHQHAEKIACLEAGVDQHARRMFCRRVSGRESSACEHLFSLEVKACGRAGWISCHLEQSTQRCTLRRKHRKPQAATDTRRAHHFQQACVRIGVTLLSTSSVLRWVRLLLVTCTPPSSVTVVAVRVQPFLCILC